jgi:hypothetical protein
MPRNISFAMTTPQFIDGSKDVTRRRGWRFLKPGDKLWAVEKSMGLQKGETVKRLGLIRVVSVKIEPLIALLSCPEYGRIEMRREGYPFGFKNPANFVDYMTKYYKISKLDPMTRIEFERIPNEDI